MAWVSQLGYASGEEPKVVIEKAIAAHGGKERLAGLKAIRMKATGTVELGRRGAVYLGHYLAIA